jgi:HEPN domain-containing protein
VNRAQLRQLAEDRILDAQRLLTGGRWAGAYYLAGYAAECGLKACIIVHVEVSGAIFQDRKFSEKCWTHDLEDLQSRRSTRMDTDTLVENLIDDGQKLVEELPQRGFEMTAAFWLKASEDGKWRFYIVSPLVDAEGSIKAYMRLHPLVRAMPQPFWIDPLKIKLIGPSNPIARDVTAILGRVRGPRVGPIRWRGTWLGDSSIEGAYLYPVPVTTP